MRSQLTKDADRLRQEQAAEFENKLHQANQKAHQLEAALRKTESLTAIHDSTTKITQKVHVAAIDVLKKDYSSTIETMRKESAAALENQAGRLQEEARKKAEAQRRDFNDKTDREKDGLHRRIADAESDKANALSSLEKTKQEAEEIIKKQAEKIRTDLNDLQSRLRIESQHEVAQLNQSHNKEQDLLRQRAFKAEAELESMRNNLKAQLDKNPQPSQIDVQPGAPSSEPLSTPFKKPRRKVDGRDVARPSSQLSSDGVGSVGDVAPAASPDAAPRIRTFAEIDSMISDSFRMQVYEDRRTSSDLTDPNSASLDPRVLRELAVNNSKRNAESGTPSGNGPVNNPFFPVVRPNSKDHALPNSALRMAAGPNHTSNAAIVGSQGRLPNNPAEVGDTQPQFEQNPMTIDKENHAPLNDPESQKRHNVTRTAHFLTPSKEKSTQARCKPTQSSSPDYVASAKSGTAHRMTTYSYSKHSNHPAPAHELQQTAQTKHSQSPGKRRRSSIENSTQNKRGKTMVEPHSFEIPETQSQMVPETETQRVQETQLVQDTSTGKSQGQSSSAMAPPASRGRTISLAQPPQRPPSSSERVSQSRARTSNARTGRVAGRGKGRTNAGRSHGELY
jgi:hypothetical protein